MVRIKTAVSKRAAHQRDTRHDRRLKGGFRSGPEPEVFERGPWTVYQYPRHGEYEAFAAVHHKDIPVASVPTDKTGNIPKDLAILRFMTEDEGGGGRKRSVQVDLGIEADNKAKLRAKTDDDRLAQYLWYMAPNESDLAKIDTPDADWAPPKVNGKRQPAVAILGQSRRRLRRYARSSTGASAITKRS